MTIKSGARILSQAVLGMLLATTPFVYFSSQLSSAQMTENAKSQLVVGQRYYISADALNARSSESTGNNVIGKLTMNDVVELVDKLSSSTPLVKVKVISSSSLRSKVGSNVYVSKDYLSTKETVVKGSQYFVIQNVATERTRVYERCNISPDCPHKLILETEMVVGRPEEGTDRDPHAFKTWLGHGKISEWVKFYQDGKAHYPHWYKAGQDIDDIPGSITGHISKHLGARRWIGKDGQGNSTIYGAFGWYAAKLTPADDREGLNYQWMHGTIGWGKDGSTAIEMTRSFLMNFLSNPGSSGCTRLENRAIAYLRSILPVGTDIYRVYARESTREPAERVLSRYSSVYNNPLPWEFILLTDGAQKNGGLEADARVVRSRASVRKGVNLIEQGVYEVDRYPNAVGLNYERPASSGLSGDRYRIDSGYASDEFRTNFRGYYLVDEGRFVDYAHPDPIASKGRVRISGTREFRTAVPAFLKASGNHYPPKANFR